MTIPLLKMNDGRALPQLGFGVWQIPGGRTKEAVREALSAGYRLIDTAAIYNNEKGVGDALRESGLQRDDVFVTTKLWNDSQASRAALKAFEDSRRRLRLDALDLYLIHWPSPRRGLYLEAWRTLIGLREKGVARSIGVSNFNAEQIDRIAGESGVVPAVNQIELHPYLQQKALRAYHERHGVVTQAWSPLGQGQLLGDPAIGAIAAKHARTPAQIVLRWHMQIGVAAIPKTASAHRMAENFAVFDFALDEDDMAAVAAMDRTDGRVGPDPATAEF